VKEFETDLETLLSMSYTGKPIGMIFHMSRCGSTALTNVLQLAENAMALGEPQPFDRAFSLYTSASTYWQRVSVRLVTALLGIFTDYRGREAQKVIVRSPHFRIGALALARQLWPDVPCVVMIRDPIEVVVSNLLRPPVWLQDRYQYGRTSPFGPLPGTLSLDSAEQYCAWTIGEFCTRALPHVCSNCIVLDYDHLSLQSALHIAHWFGLRFSDKGLRESAEIFGKYSKNTSRAFVPDRAAKQGSASAEAIRSVSVWAADSYQALRALSSSISYSAQAASESDSKGGAQYI
jgi:hypothetical protein